MPDYYDLRECMPQEEREHQKTLQMLEMLRAGHQKSSRIRKAFADLGFHYNEIKTLADFQLLPVISREKLIELETMAPPFRGIEQCRSRN